MIPVETDGVFQWLSRRSGASVHAELRKGLDFYAQMIHNLHPDEDMSPDPES